MTSSPKGDLASCYVSSEHCYQKPGASWEKAEETEKEEQEDNTELKVTTSVLRHFVLNSYVLRPSARMNLNINVVNKQQL